MGSFHLKDLAGGMTMRVKKAAALILAGTMLMTTAFCGCGTETMDKTATVVTVNGTEVPLGFAYFVARYEQAQRDQFYVQYMGEKVWQSDSDGDGQTIEDTTKADIMDMIAGWYVLEQNAEQYNVTVTDAEKAQIAEAAKTFMESNTQEALDQMGATQEYAEQMLYYKALTQKMQQVIEAEATITVTDADAAQRTFSYILLGSLGETGEDGTFEYYDEEQLAAKETELQAEVERAKADFDAVAKEYEYEDTNYSYGANDTTMDAALIEAADTLKEGEVSGLVKGTNGYFVLRLDSEYDKEASEKNKNSLIAAERQEYYEGVVAEYKEAAEISVEEDQWAKVKFDTLFTIVTDSTTTEE